MAYEDRRGPGADGGVIGGGGRPTLDVRMPTFLRPLLILGAAMIRTE
ncbi:MAG TPA: hypothetical protein VM198_07310 [Longimicrobiales bacterium]|nr:hypothetical protein [Longimicrobiales bacterium]